MTDKSLIKVPFYPQTWDISTWKEMGFSSEEDARYWERSCCGILCIKMAAEFFLKKSFSTHGLIMRGLELQGYTDALGWKHQGLVDICNDLNLTAKYGNFTPDEIVESIEKGHLVIVSIKWGFRSHKTPKEKVLFWKKYGGHLALVIGVKKTGSTVEGFFVHHTSTHEGYDWPEKYIEISDFKKGYTGRGILIQV